MAPAKRKSSGKTESTRPEKKQKLSVPSTKTAVLREEEPAFPRGGASILTPLEHKQIQIQATNDVLFEQSTGKKSARNEFEDGENKSDRSNHTSGAPPKVKRKKKPQNEKLVEASADAGIRIEGLSYKVASIDPPWSID